MPTPLPTAGLTIPNLHSDVLFQPSFCAAFDPELLFGSTFKANISTRDGRGVEPNELPDEPVIFTRLMRDWAGMNRGSKREWGLESLGRRFEEVRWRAEATLVQWSTYRGYHDRCAQDESPLYLFESDFVEKTKAAKAWDEGGRGRKRKWDERQEEEEKEKEEGEEQGEKDGGMGEDYQVPECFGEDLFALMGTARPDYRWLVRSFHPLLSSQCTDSDPIGFQTDCRPETKWFNLASRSQRHFSLERRAHWI